MAVYRVLSASGAHSRLDIASPHGLTPLVGREQEVGFLLERWAHVKAGHGHVVLLRGEAGIGKSRLVQVLKEQVAEEPHTQWECRCSPYYQHTAFYPLIDLLQRALRWHADETPDEKLRKLEHTLHQYRLPVAETLPLFATLLSLPISADRYAPLVLSPQRQRQKTFETIVALLCELATQHPVLFILEDLHWIDPSTLEFLTLLFDQVPTARLLTLLTCRPEFPVPWTLRADLAQLTLGRLGRPEVEGLVTRVLQGKALPPEVLHQVVAKTDGVPLFVEELTKMVLESGLLQEREDGYELTGPLPALAIPTTLQDSLMARLDRLATVKVVAQLGATIGRQFSYALLQAVTPLDEAAVQHGLRQLVDADLVYQQGVPPQATYLFKHALIQDAAYQSLLKSTRQQYHDRIAHILVEQFPAIVEVQPELLAHHYTEAGLPAQAISYWQRAGQHALERSANVEAVRHFTECVALLKTLPATSERTAQELALHIAMAVPLIATLGYGAPEVAHAYSRAQALCQQVGDHALRFSALRGVWNCRLMKAELVSAHALGEQLMRLAQDVQDPAVLVEAHRALGTTLLFLGQLSLAHAHLAQGIALYGVCSGYVCMVSTT